MDVVVGAAVVVVVGGGCVVVVATATVVVVVVSAGSEDVQEATVNANAMSITAVDDLDVAEDTDRFKRLIMTPILPRPATTMTVQNRSTHASTAESNPPSL